MNFFISFIIIMLLLTSCSKTTSIEDNIYNSIKEGNLGKLDKLIYKSRKHYDDFYPPLIYYAIKHNQKTIVEYLIKKGFIVNDESVDLSFLGQAARKNNVAIVKLLIKNGADINSKDKRNGWTPLFETTLNDSADAAKVLLENGANPNVVDKFNTLVLSHAIISHSTKVAKQLLKYKADIFLETKNQVCPLILTIEKDNAVLLEAMIKQYKLKDKINTLPFRKTLLEYAVRDDAVKSMKLLLKMGSEPNTLKYINGGYITPLDIAELKHNSTMIDVLNAYGAKTALQLNKKPLEKSLEPLGTRQSP